MSFISTGAEPALPPITHIFPLKLAAPKHHLPEKAAEAVALVQLDPFVENQTSLRPVPELLIPPITHIIPLKTKLDWPERVEKPALVVTVFQVDPLNEE
jgi:hypothetical protein